MQVALIAPSCCIGHKNWPVMVVVQWKLSKMVTV